MRCPLFCLETIQNGLRCALAIFSGNHFYSFGTPERLRTLRCTFFTGENLNGKQALSTNPAVFLCVPTCEKGILKSPQAFQNPG